MTDNASPPPPPPPTTDPHRALRRLGALNQLMLEAGLAETEEEFRFRLLNRTILLAEYDRALLWDLSGTTPRLLGVSGEASVNASAELPTLWTELARELTPPAEAKTLAAGDVGARGEEWSRLAEKTGGLAVAWVPIRAAGQPVAALWLERWGGAKWPEDEVRALGSLGLLYGIAWRAHGTRRLVGWRRHLRPGPLGLGLAVVLALLLTFVRLPLRVVAPCETVPEDPVVVTAPLDGVVAEVLVEPGANVEAGTPLAVYDRRVAMEEWNVAQQQVRIVESDLQRIRVNAVDDPRLRPEIALLENRLEQEQARLELARIRTERLEIRAPTAGRVVLNDPNAWRGRPVRVGERLLEVLHPGRTRLRIWLPLADGIEFDPDRPVRIVFHAEPGETYQADLQFVNPYGEISPGGVPSFRAMARWRGESPVRVGLTGAAILHGPEVSLGYWLFRKPLGAFREWTGW